MRTLFLILADSAQVVDGKLYMLGGAWNRIFADALPSSRLCAIAVGLEMAAGEIGQRHSLKLTMLLPGDEAEQDLVRGEFEVGAAPDVSGEVPPSVAAAFPVVLKLNRAGKYVAKLYVDGSTAGEVPLEVVQRSQ